MTIMQRMEELCAERGWTLYELSNRTSISVCTLYSCKKKNHEPTNETLKKICAAFGITVFQFYHDLYEIRFDGGTTESIIYVGIVGG